MDEGPAFPVTPKRGGTECYELQGSKLGFQGLPKEVISRILSIVEKTCPLPVNVLLPLRLVSKGFRDAVDLTFSTLVVKSRGGRRSGESLWRVENALGDAFRRWPSITHLDLTFDWGYDCLEHALHFLADGLPSLRQLDLEALYSRTRSAAAADHDRRASLPGLLHQTNLTSLSVRRFVSYPGWEVGLSALSSLRVLHLDQSSFSLELEPLPALRDLLVVGYSHPEEEQETSHFNALCHTTSLESLTLSDLVIPELPLPSSLAHLALTTVSGHARLRHFSNLSALETLTLSNTAHNTLPSLSHLSHLQTLILRHLPAPVLPPLTGLTSLETLILENMQMRALPELGRLPSLVHLSIDGCPHLARLPALDGLTALRHLTVTHCAALPAAPDLSALSSLACLDLSGCQALTTVPGLEYLPRLQTVNVEHCPRLKTLLVVNQLQIHL